MSHLVIDIGNTMVKLGIFGEDDPEIRHLSEFSGNALEELCRNQTIEACIFSSVSMPEQKMLEFLRDIPLVVRLDHKTPLPIVNDYSTPETLGHDRLACAVAAQAIFPGEAVLSVDAGTCIKYDFVSPEGHYLGGAISPGLAMRLKAMHTFTARLPLVDLSTPITMIGNSTNSSLLSGAVAGAIAEVKQCINDYRTQYPGLKVILSGGDSKYFEKPLKNRIFAVPELALQGLHLILKYNVEKQ